MSFQIKELVLYGRKGERKVLPFHLGTLNLIVGASGTGKSQIINIVEYCLGRTSCPIAVGTIIKSVAWFGLRLKTGSGYIFVARESPEGGTMNKMSIQSGPNVEIPAMTDLKANTNNDAVVQHLSREAGISPNKHIPPEGHTRPALEANIKHSMFFTSQAQYEIANPAILFHRQAEDGIDRAIRDTIRYFLGAVDEKELELMKNLAEARRLAKLALRAFNEAKARQATSMDRGLGLLAEAREANILFEDDDPQNEAQLHGLLKKALSWSPTKDPVDSTTKLHEYRKRESDLRDKYTHTVARLSEANEFAAETERFVEEASIQASRLSFVDIYPKTEDNDLLCPLCLQKDEDLDVRSEPMRRSAKELEDTIQVASRERPRILEYTQKLDDERTRLKAELASVNEAIRAAISTDDKARKLRDKNALSAQVVGRIDYYLETTVETQDLKKLESNLSQAHEDVEELENLLSRESADERLDAIAAEISDRITEIAREMDLEHSEHHVRLDLRRLTVVIQMADGKLTPMFRIGSGENHEGYHVATYLALHEWFVKKKRPVPGFLILDQPSQVYSGGVQSDRLKIERLCRLLTRTCKELDGKLQILVMDHLPNEPPFAEAIVADWWKGDALVPPAWIT